MQMGGELSSLWSRNRQALYGKYGYQGELAAFSHSAWGHIRRTDFTIMSISKAIMAAVAAVILLAGCASMPMTTEGPQDINDPLEPFNRLMFNTTLALDKGVLRPTALVYRRVVPEPVRDSLRNFLNNLDSPIIFTNDVLQGEF